MHVAVGSENPVKVAATERALSNYAETTVESVAVRSGVPEQPRGHAQTIAGAQNRADEALADTGANLGVGIEGGVAEIRRDSTGDREWSKEVAPIAGSSDLFLVMWAAATNGAQTGRGGGPSIRLPENVASRVRDGDELGPVMNELCDLENVAETVGAAGVLTDGIIDRESALAHAVGAALAPFVSEFY